MTLELRNSAGERLDHVLTPGASGSSAVVVVGHGVTSHHDRPLLVDLCEGLRAAGIASLRFSFAGNGASEGAFADATLTKEARDLGSVLDALAGHRVAYVGHSMGAAVGVLRAAEDRRIEALVSLAGMVHVDAFMRRHFGTLVPGRDPMLGKPACVLSKALLDDAARLGSVLDAARRVAVPWLLVHGDADELVPLQDSRDALAASGGRAELVVVAGADHRFTDAHARVVRAVVRWCRGVL